MRVGAAGLGSAHSAPWPGSVLEAALDDGLNLPGLVEEGDQRDKLDIDLAHRLLETAEPSR